MKKKSVAALFTAACLAAGSLAGCSGTSSTASSEAADNTEASDAAQSADNTASDDDTKDLEDVTVILDLRCQHQPHRYVCRTGSGLL